MKVSCLIPFASKHRKVKTFLSQGFDSMNQTQLIRKRLGYLIERENMLLCSRETERKMVTAREMVRSRERW